MIVLNILTLMMLFAAPLAAQESSWERTRSVAETQHEIIMLLIEKKQFTQIPNAAEKIFQLDFPEDHENLFVREAQILTNALVHHQEFVTAHKVMDIAIKCAWNDKVKARIFREKAYLFKIEGNSEEALRYFEESLELAREAQPSPD
jgi:tetratricopeptide (TPR) repeat protein